MSAEYVPGHLVGKDHLTFGYWRCPFDTAEKQIMGCKFFRVGKKATGYCINNANGETDICGSKAARAKEKV